MEARPKSFVLILSRSFHPSSFQEHLFADTIHPFFYHLNICIETGVNSSIFIQA